MKISNTDMREKGKCTNGGGKEQKEVLHSHSITVQMYSPGRSSEWNTPLKHFCCSRYALQGPGKHWDISLQEFMMFLCSFYHISVLQSDDILNFIPITPHFGPF